MRTPEASHPPSDGHPGLVDLQPEHAKLWGRHPVRIQHQLPESTLFSDATLGRLIEGYPRHNYDLLHMAEQGTGNMKEWREGDLGRCSGAEVLQAIADGRLWLNLRRVHEVDPRYNRLLDELFEALAAGIPELKPRRLNLGILISSPGAQVYYHADLPGQSLWQVRGTKRVFVYPNSPPFLPEDQIEGIVLNQTEAEIHYEPWFDEHARVFRLAPGEMLNWPLNAPHRVENHDMVNISVTTEHWTPESRNLYATRYTNGLVRRRLGIEPGPPTARGLRVWPKAAVALAVKRSGLMDKERFPKRIEWELAPGEPDQLREVTPWLL